MKKLLHLTVCALLVAVFMLSAAGTALAGGMENEDFLNCYGRVRETVPADKEWATVDKLVLLSRSGDYEFTGEDADADGSVTLEVGNTYNFVLEKSAMGGSLEGTGIVLRANEHASYLPLDNEGTYAIIDYGTPVSERVEFIDVSLNSDVKQEEYAEDYPFERSPSFSLSGKVVCTMTFEVGSVYHVGDGSITYENEENHYDYMAEAEALDTGLFVTYTITIEGSSNGVYTDYLYDGGTTAASGIGYNSGISGAGSEAVYTLDIEVDGEDRHYDLMDPEEKINWLSVDIKFDISDWSLATLENENYIDVSEEHTHMTEHHESRFLRAARSTAVAVCGAVLGLLGCAASNVLAGAGGAVAAGAAGGAEAPSGSISEKADDGTPELPEEDTEGVSVSVDVTFEDLLNEKGAAVTMPISVSGGDGGKWHYIVSTVSNEAPKVVVPSAAGDNAVLALTGNLNGKSEADVTLFVTAWSRGADGKIIKGSAAEELTVHAEGLTAELNDGKLKVTLCTPSRVKGVAEVSELSEGDYEISDGIIRAKSNPNYTCKLPEEAK